MKSKNKCCDVLGNPLDLSKNWFKSKIANGEEWTPAFIIKVVPEKCISCGMCVNVCLNNIYEMKEVKGKRVAVAVYPEKCFGDCHCHKVCPVTGALICKPKVIK